MPQSASSRDRLGSRGVVIVGERLARPPRGGRCMSEVDCKTYSVFETYPRATPKPSLTSRDHLHGRRGRAAARWAHAVAPPCNAMCRDLRTPTSEIERNIDIPFIFIPNTATRDFDQCTVLQLITGSAVTHVVRWSCTVTGAVYMMCKCDSFIFSQ